MKPGEETSDLQPSMIDSWGVDRLKKLAKRKQKELGLNRTEALELVAKEHGFKNWNNVHRFASKRPNTSDFLYIEELWGKTMFVEFKASKTTLTDFYTASVGLLVPLDSDVKINLSQVARIRFAKGFKNDVGYFEELDGDHDNCCRVIVFEYMTSVEIDRYTYLFPDEGEFHRAKRLIEDLTTPLKKT